MILSCRDLGRPCDFVATGDRPEAVKRAILRHAETAHLDAVTWMTPREIRRFEAAIDAKLAEEQRKKLPT